MKWNSDTGLHRCRQEWWRRFILVSTLKCWRPILNIGKRHQYATRLVAPASLLSRQYYCSRSQPNFVRDSSWGIVFRYDKNVIFTTDSTTFGKSIWTWCWKYQRSIKSSSKIISSLGEFHNSNSKTNFLITLLNEIFLGRTAKRKTSKNYRRSQEFGVRSEQFSITLGAIITWNEIRASSWQKWPNCNHFDTRNFTWRYGFSYYIGQKSVLFDVLERPRPSSFASSKFMHLQKKNKWIRSIGK